MDLLHGPWLFENKIHLSFLSQEEFNGSVICPFQLHRYVLFYGHGGQCRKPRLSIRASGISFIGFNAKNDHSTEAADTGISATKPLFSSFHYGLKKYSNSCW